MESCGPNCLIVARTAGWWLFVIDVRRCVVVTGDVLDVIHVHSEDFLTQPRCEAPLMHAAGVIGSAERGGELTGTGAAVAT